jgi:hypothetical protein
MRMTCYHLSGSLQRKTQPVDAEAVRFGTGDRCGIRYDTFLDAAVQPVHADLVFAHGIPIVLDRSGKRLLFVNGPDCAQVGRTNEGGRSC